MAPRTRTSPSTTTTGTRFSFDESQLGSTLSFTVDSKTYEVGKKIAEGDISDLYECTIPATVSKGGGTWYDRILEEDGLTLKGVLKVVKDLKFNPLSETEVNILDKLFPRKESEAKFFRYLPRVLESGTLDSGRAAVILPFFEGYVTMQQIREAFPNGLDFRDIVWMFKRTLVAIGYAHTQGVVHGAVLPPHVMVHPIDHGAKLLDWIFAVEAGDHIKGVSSGFGDFYPPETFDKVNARPSADIFMAGKCAIALLGGNPQTDSMPETVPPEIQAFFLGCVEHTPSRRPQDAWDLHETFDNLLLKLVGKPTYRPLTMPA